MCFLSYIKFICALLQIIFKMTANASVPCGICHFDCVEDREIFCDTCETWFHYSCENLTNKAFNLFSKSPLPYSCSLCNFYLDTRKYKYEKALRTLSEATRKGMCDEAIKVEFTLPLKFKIMML